MFVEDLRALVLGVDHDGVDGERVARVEHAAQRIEEQRRTEPLAAPAAIDPEAPEQGDRGPDSEAGASWRFRARSRARRCPRSGCRNPATSSSASGIATKTRDMLRRASCDAWRRR